MNFVNNATPYKSPAETNSMYVVRNYGNMKAQCYMKLKELMEKRQVRVYADGQVKDDICNELDNIVVKNLDKDTKVYMESKEEMKRRLGRSPDYADNLMMRMIWIVRNDVQTVREEDTGVFETNWDDVLC